MSYYAFANLLKFTQLNMKNSDYFLSQETINSTLNYRPCKDLTTIIQIKFSPSHIFIV